MDAPPEELALRLALISRDYTVQRFNPNHAPAGAATGGQFTSSGGGQAPAKQGAAGRRARKARLLEQAHRDRARAHVLQAELRRLTEQHHASKAAHAKAAKQAAHHAAQAKVHAKAGSGAAGHHQRLHTHHRQQAAHHQTQAAAHHKHITSLAERITKLKDQIRTLLDKAKALEAQARKL